MGKTQRVLLVCANPRGTDPLRTAEEDRTLRESIQLSTNRDMIQVDTLNAATIDDLRRALLNNKYDVVHFSGHGTNTGLVFEDTNGKLMVPSSSALSELLERRDVKTAVLNACYSLSVGRIASIGLDYTVASTGPISDPAAIEFTRGFYDALGAGLSVPEAFDEGLSSAKLKNLRIDSILLPRGQEYIPPEETAVESDSSRDTEDAPTTLLGIAIDASGSMQASINNRDGRHINRFDGVQESIADVGAQIRDELKRRSSIPSDSFKVFVYAFGLRIGDGVADLATLWKATQLTDIENEIEIRKRRYEADARRQADGYGGLASLARSYGFGGLVDSVTEAAKDSIREKIVGEIAGKILNKANEIGDTTLTAEELASLFDSPVSKKDARAVEHVIFGLTPMNHAVREIEKRYQRSEDYNQRILLVISDGEPTDGNPTETFSRLRENGVTVISCFVTDEDIANPRALVASPREVWTKGATLMWNIASEADEQGPFGRYLLQQGWSIEKKSRLFVQVNHSDVLKEFVRLAGSHFTSRTVELLPKGQ